MQGAGIYDEEATAIRERLHAQGIILAVVNGDLGSGFSVQLRPELRARMPGLLRRIAEQMEKDLKEID